MLLNILTETYNNKSKIKNNSIVMVYENNSKIYEGLEESEPMQNENWIFNESLNQYELMIMGNKYTKKLK